MANKGFSVRRLFSEKDEQLENFDLDLVEIDFNLQKITFQRECTIQDLTVQSKVSTTVGKINKNTIASAPNILVREKTDFYLSSRFSSREV